MTNILEDRNKKQNVLDRLEKWVEKQFAVENPEVQEYNTKEEKSCLLLRLLSACFARKRDQNKEFYRYWGLEGGKS